MDKPNIQVYHSTDNYDKLIFELQPEAEKEECLKNIKYITISWERTDKDINNIQPLAGNFVECYDICLIKKIREKLDEFIKAFHEPYNNKEQHNQPA